MHLQPRLRCGGTGGGESEREKGGEERARRRKCGGLFKRASQLLRMNEYSGAVTETAESGGLCAPGDLSWKRPGEMVQITANIQIPTLSARRRPCANYSRYECL